MSRRCFSDPPSRKYSNLRTMTYSGGGEHHGFARKFHLPPRLDRPVIHRVSAGQIKVRSDTGRVMNDDEMAPLLAAGFDRDRFRRWHVKIRLGKCTRERRNIGFP